MMAMLSGRAAWLVVLVLFMGASWVANRWAHSETSVNMQYMGLGLYVVAEAIIFLPLLYIAQAFFPGAIQTAAIMTLAVFAGLTLVVFTTKRDYSYIQPVLSIGGMLALGFIVASLIFGFSDMMMLIFCFFMVALASGYIIYQTSVIMHHYRTDQHVGAALGLFASVALLFWYILQIVMSSSRD
jgi:FtsH-binding integral membrane protein